MLTLKTCGGVFSGVFKARMLKLGIHMDNELLYCGIENRTAYLSCFLCFIQSNFNGSNTFGARKISLRQG